MFEHFIVKVWSKIARRALRLARNYLLILMRYVIFAVISLAGSKMLLKKPAAPSLWSEWSEKKEPGLIFKQNETNWLCHYLSWTCQKGNLWGVFLLPFILTLKATEETAERPSPESLMIYTLF